MTELEKVSDIPVGVVGLGLMGCSIATCLLIAGHPVIAVAPISSDMNHASKRIGEHLSRSHQQKMVSDLPEVFLKNLVITEDYTLLKDCKIVVECTLEDLDIKKNVYAKIEYVID